MNDPRDWDLEYDGAAPALPPEMVRKNIHWAEQVTRLLPEGAYFLRFEPCMVCSVSYEAPRVLAGFLRIHHRNERKRNRKRLLSSGSGDLYVCSREDALALEKGFAEQDESTRFEEIQKTLQRHHYRYYLCLKSLWVTAQDHVILGFDTHRYTGEEQGWQRRQAVTMHLKASPPKPPEEPLSATVLNSHETQIGNIHILRLTKKKKKRGKKALLRHAVVEIHATDFEDQKTLMRQKALWRKRMGEAGWSVRLKKADKNLPTEKEWTRYQLQKYHAESIDGAANDDLWIYHLLIVDEIAFGDNGKPRGLMYDIGKNDDEGPPRQGAALAAKQMAKEAWNHAGSAPPRAQLFLRTALHELGHMQGLYHNPASPGIMQPLEYLENQWISKREGKYDDKNAFRLRHLPDLWVRPGGVPFGYRYRASAIDVLDLVPANEGDSAGIELTILPIEAPSTDPPVEIVMTLWNGSGRDILCPLPRYALPRNRRFGLWLDTPSGESQEILPLRFPRQLRGKESTSLLRCEKITYRIPWNEKWNVRDAGTYLLHAHLMWVVKKKATRGNPYPVLYHVSATGRLRVT